MKYKEMCRILHRYTCPSCGNDMLFFTKARTNIVIDYKNLTQTKTDDEVMEHLANSNVEYLKCMVCKKMYIIDWTKGYARPLLYKDTLRQFGYRFKE